jgi:hypothetical protein
VILSRLAGWATAPGDSLSGVECARVPAEDLDEESSVWLRRLGAGGGERQAAERELHARLVRIALAEVRRRSASTPVTGPELDDVAHQAADDAMLAVPAKLGDFRGESRTAGEDAAGRYPGAAAHLLACGPCSEDFTGLVQAVTNG